MDFIIMLLRSFYHSWVDNPENFEKNNMDYKKYKNELLEKLLKLKKPKLNMFQRVYYYFYPDKKHYYMEFFEILNIKLKFFAEFGNLPSGFWYPYDVLSFIDKYYPPRDEKDWSGFSLGNFFVILRLIIKYLMNSLFYSCEYCLKEFDSFFMLKSVEYLNSELFKLEYMNIDTHNYYLTLRLLDILYSFIYFYILIVIFVIYFFIFYIYYMYILKPCFIMFKDHCDKTGITPVVVKVLKKISDSIWYFLQELWKELKNLFK